MTIRVTRYLHIYIGQGIRWAIRLYFRSHQLNQNYKAMGESNITIIIPYT